MDIVVKKGGCVSQVLENVSPRDVAIMRTQDGQIDAPWQLELASCKRFGRLSLNRARSMGFPANYLMVTIQGKLYFVDAGFKSSSALDALNLIH